MSTKIYMFLLIFVSGLMVSEATRGRYKQRVPHLPGVSHYHRPRVFTKHYAPVMKPNINNPPSLHASVVQKADYTKPEDVPATKPETLSWLNKSKDKLKSATNSIKDVYKAKIEDKFQPAMSTTRFGFKSLRGVSDTVSAVDNINNFG
ncbi:uncharacterized protein LOC131845458 [Achroia grisella]|uniref:uncharacterized protein LOC131845458 n=1 Tax=Achroia grisella TaxID=688607 RepID=UPI0027D331CC|nr:uncharacterized protein LOC131845458 [Achroia grisella]